MTRNAVFKSALLICLSVIACFSPIALSAADEKTPALPPDLGTRKQGVDWPGFLGPTADSISPEKGILTKWPAAGPRLVWQTELGLGYGAPVVSRGRLFQFDRDDDQARLRCLESENGKPLWEFKYPSSYQDTIGYDSGPRCSPVVDGNRVYIFGVEGMLHCLNVQDGSVIWKLDTADKFHVIQNFFGVGSTPVIEGDLLIAQIGGSPADNRPFDLKRLDLVKGNGCGIVAFDKLTGEVKYQLTDELAGYAAPKLATIKGRRWCFVFARGGLVGFDPTTGKLDFEYPWRATDLYSVNASTPVVVDDMVFISETYGPGSSLLRVKPGGYDVVWKDIATRRGKNMQTHWNTPVYADGYLYASSGRHTENAELRCIELATGNVAWSKPGLSRASLLLVDGHLICLCEDGNLILLKLNPAKYEPLAEVTLRDKERPAAADGMPAAELLQYPAWAAPILSHGLLYVRGKDRLACLELIPAK